MKVLWLCNITLPEISEKLNKDKTNVGGWISSMASLLLEKDNFSLVYLFPNKGENIKGNINNLFYYGFDENNSYNTFDAILQKEKPDVVHIFGTEYAHTLIMVDACEQLNLLNKTVINIQGLTSVIAKHYYADLPSSVINGFTFRDFIKQDNIAQQRKKFEKRGIDEIKALRKCRHVIGRTTWDKACTTKINPKINYHHCNEILRKEFYKHKWNIDNCEKYSIFVSQAHYPIKGMHYLLEAMPHILSNFPKAHVYTTGPDLLNMSLKQKVKMNSYQKYLIKLIKKYNLENNITFLGNLNEKQMCEQYLKSHVFVSSSAIENSPNSVCEAMMLGVPTVSSMVGGVSTLLNHEIEGYLYQHNASYMLSYYICNIFSNSLLAQKFSSNSAVRAHKTHCVDEILNTLLSFYAQLEIE